MFINFGFNPFEDDFTEEFVIEIKNGNSIQKQILQTTSEIAQMQFIGLLQQVSRTESPIRIRILKKEQIWDKFDKTFKILENYIQFANKSYMNNFKKEFEGE